MSTTAPPRPLIRLHVTARPVPDTEPPYDDPPARLAPSRPAFTEGSLALASTAWPDAPVVPDRAPLRLVPPTGPSAAPADAAPPVHSGDPDDDFAVVRTARQSLPAPGPRAAVLVRAIMETVCGDRPAGQLMRWVTPAVYAEIESSIYAGAPRSWAASMRRLIVTEPADGVAEIAAVVQRGVRATALAMRLEGLDGRWVVTALQLG